MNYNPEEHHRRSIRLKNYDYRQAGCYFITICTNHREMILGKIKFGVMKLNQIGKVVEYCWNQIPEHFPNVVLDDFIMIPNHIHGILGIIDVKIVGERHTVPLRKSGYTIEKYGKPVPGSIPTIIRSFKSAVTKRINVIHKSPGAPVWQRNYYEHIVRD